MVSPGARPGAGPSLAAASSFGSAIALAAIMPELRVAA
jgi:hypothetical protein